MSLCPRTPEYALRERRSDSARSSGRKWLMRTASAKRVANTVTSFLLLIFFSVLPAQVLQQLQGGDQRNVIFQKRR
jgi:lipopolysaccharide/colanic/teichoic acid biosynthesis glycosyltransferase